MVCPLSSPQTSTREIPSSALACAHVHAHAIDLWSTGLQHQPFALILRVLRPYPREPGRRRRPGSLGCGRRSAHLLTPGAQPLSSEFRWRILALAHAVCDSSVLSLSTAPECAMFTPPQTPELVAAYSKGGGSFTVQAPSPIANGPVSVRELVFMAIRAG